MHMFHLIFVPDKIKKLFFNKHILTTTLATLKLLLLLLVLLVFPAVLLL